jgi:hypothetical protein
MTIQTNLNIKNAILGLRRTLEKALQPKTGSKEILQLRLLKLLLENARTADILVLWAIWDVIDQSQGIAIGSIVRFSRETN